MNRHPYLRAYMAGVLMPTWFLLVVLLVFVASRAEMPHPLERIIVFPLVGVPNLWGLWNTLYLAMGLKSRMPLGAWGALLPLILVPGGYSLGRALDVSVFTPTEGLIVLPIGMGIYYLAWKHIVGFFNRVVGVEG